jgi:hypothetical protein
MGTPYSRREHEQAELAELRSEFGERWAIESVWGGYRAVERPAQVFTAMEVETLRDRLRAAEALRAEENRQARTN